MVGEGMYLSSDGTKLVVIASKYQYFYLLMGGLAMPTYRVLGAPMLPAYQANVYTYINVYDGQTKLLQCLPETSP